MRIMTIQLNGYPTPPMGSRGKAKMIILGRLISKIEPDIILMQEENKNWNQIKKKDSPKYNFDHMGIVTNHAYNKEKQAYNRVCLQGGATVWTIGATRGI